MNLIKLKKIQNLSKVIAEIGFQETKALPTIIGLCEVENKKVLVDLINTKLLKISTIKVVSEQQALNELSDLTGITSISR